MKPRPWSKPQSRSHVGHFYSKESLQTSKSGASLRPDRLTRGWFMHISVCVFFLCKMEHFRVRRDSLHREGKEQETEPVGKQRPGLPTDPHLCKSPVPLLTPRTSTLKEWTKHRFLSTSGPLHDINNFHLKALSSLNIWEAVLMSYFCLTLFPWGETHQNSSVRVQWKWINYSRALHATIFMSSWWASWFPKVTFFKLWCSFWRQNSTAVPQPSRFLFASFLCVCV